jgi:hypothetical protein
VAGNARLGKAEDACQFRDIQALGRQQPQNPQPGIVSKETKEGAAEMHIYESTLVDRTTQDL